MKAVTLHEHGGPGKLTYEEIDNPTLRKDEILVRVKACAVNHLDIWVRKGLPGKKLRFPHILGCDIVGEVTSKNRNFPVGTRVVVYPGISCGKCVHCKKGKENLCNKFSIIGGFSDYKGGYAEYVSVPSVNLVRIPSWLSFDEAACLPVSYLISWNMLNSLDVKKGTTLLVYGAGSGVGSATIKLAKALGATVITTVGDDSKIAGAKKIGAKHVVNRKKQNIVDEVIRITKAGVDTVVDHVGASTWMTSINSLRIGGRMAVCGATAGETANVEIRTLYNKQIAIIGAYSGTKAGLLEMMAFMKGKKIKPVIDRKFDLGKAAEAHKRMEQSNHFGKILLKP